MTEFKIGEEVTVLSTEGACSPEYLATLRQTGFDPVGKHGVITGILRLPDGERDYSVRMFDTKGRTRSTFLGAKNIALRSAEGETK